MNNELSKIKSIAIFIAGVSAASMPAMATAEWSIVGLGTLGGVYSTANGINDSGQVVGESTMPDGSHHAFITEPNGVGITDLGTLGGVYSIAYGINDSGRVVGESTMPDGSHHAFITEPNGVGMTDLGTLGGTWSTARGINDSGQVVGGSSLSSVGGHAFITGPNGAGMTDLGALWGGYSLARGISDSGQVVGNMGSLIESFSSSAFITGPDGVDMTGLSFALGVRVFDALGINDSGQVVVFGSHVFGDPSHAFIIESNGASITSITDLGTLGGVYSTAYGINDSGQVVGTSSTKSGDDHAFIYSHSGGMLDLSLLPAVVESGWSRLTPTAINNKGQIVGYGYHLGHHEPEAFLLSAPIPEPQTYAMLLAGLGLLGFMARRRKESTM